MIFLSNKGFNDFHDFVCLYKERSVKEDGSVIIKDLLKDLKLKEYYENQRTTDGIERWENIEELISSISEFEDNNKDKGEDSAMPSITLDSIHLHTGPYRALLYSSHN